ncbi:DUF6173 family protein [Robertmurraya kyonggiensis]|uniref:Uncharacterized protein n=1 Tax=Robertmurraya kyonggiensis TaxID=1037680 RepID=A0A4U1CWX9_9BACI|nr:DUF6173 family protein [Robertmurraya kyonggiensis]TKC14355.1 hypothetical protein FA727_21580 [Robertmurraya kyonggiensis]
MYMDVGKQLANIKFKDDANTIAEDLIIAVTKFNLELDDNHEVGVMLASFGQTITVNITGIGYQGSKLIKFTGFLVDGGSPVELLQHVSQLNFLLISLPRENPEEPKKNIGFITS